MKRENELKKGMKDMDEYLNTMNKKELIKFIQGLIVGKTI